MDRQPLWTNVWFHSSVGFAVPEHVLGLEFELGPRISMSRPLLLALNHVWTNYASSYPLYAARLNTTHANSPEFVSDTFFFFSAAIPFFCNGIFCSVVF